jgi:hypothetical protein
MNSKHLSVIAVVAALAAMLVASTTMISADNAFAGKKSYGKSQAIAQASDCGNGFVSVANFCQEIGAQNQGEENSVAQSGNQEINIGIGDDDDIINEPGDVVICHRAPGNPTQSQTLSLSENAANAHLEQHEFDTEGPCPPR